MNGQKGIGGLLAKVPRLSKTRKTFTGEIDNRTETSERIEYTYFGTKIEFGLSEPIVKIQHDILEDEYKKFIAEISA
jgi:dihydropteroate synthase